MPPLLSIVLAVYVLGFFLTGIVLTAVLNRQVPDFDVSETITAALSWPLWALFGAVWILVQCCTWVFSLGRLWRRR